MLAAAESHRSARRSATRSPTRASAAPRWEATGVRRSRPTKGRNVVERYFALAKQWRGLATRYDKLAITYRATAVLCAVLTWLRK